MPLPMSGFITTRVINDKTVRLRPFGEGHCRKCGRTIWWAKNQAAKFLPPFADANYNAWHVCGSDTLHNTEIPEHAPVHQDQAGILEGQTTVGAIQRTSASAHQGTFDDNAHGTQETEGQKPEDVPEGQGKHFTPHLPPKLTSHNSRSKISSTISSPSAKGSPMSDPLFDAPAREPLFEDDPNDGAPFQYEPTDFSVTRLAGARQKALAQVERIKAQKADYIKWYDNRVDAIERRVDEIETSISDIMHTMDVKNVATPLGTFTLRQSTKTIWPKDHEILVWVEQIVPAAHHATLLRFAASPDKDAIKKFMAEKGLKLPGFSVTSRETLVLRKTSLQRAA